MNPAPALIPPLPLFPREWHVPDDSDLIDLARDQWADLSEIEPATRAMLPGLVAAEAGA